MRSESGMGRSRNLLTPWAHRKRNIATVKITDQTVSTAHEGKLWTWFNLLQHVSELREARTACRKRRLSLRSRPRGCAAAQRLCWPALAHKHEVKKNVLHCELLCSSFFFRHKCNCRPDCQENWPDSINTWHHYFSSTHVFSLCGCRCEPAAASSWIIQWKYYKWPRAVIVRGNNEVSLVPLTLFDDATLLLTGTPT